MTNDSADVTKYAPFKTARPYELVKWIEANFSSFNEFREFYATIIYPHERKLTKEDMWKE